MLVEQFTTAAALDLDLDLGNDPCQPAHLMRPRGVRRTAPALWLHGAPLTAVAHHTPIIDVDELSTPHPPIHAPSVVTTQQIAPTPAAAPSRTVAAHRPSRYEPLPPAPICIRPD